MQLLRVSTPVSCQITQSAAFAPDSLTGTLDAEIPVAFKRKGDVTFPALEFRYFDPARRAVARQLELEPWCEETHRTMMRLLALNGQRSAALQQY